ncbi:GntR family transcriptional regulator [Sinirhodobacter populi]|uniref:GntR family transcriptional regulator n=1 Tax=Paenirhodobacter populi TaxID=2306993 RepID=A0A443J4G5_9RHOB|nr:GntR family transcriptional regulator [Sinirhodobacter populi]RWR15339.1 GntR family transcriptional regulator [Sinirhodobacter populi]
MPLFFGDFHVTLAQDQTKPAGTGTERLADKAYAEILGRILSGVLPAGMVVPERRLTEDVGLSRSRIREALARLEGEGLLRRDRTGALSIRNVTLSDALHAAQLAQMLEPPLACVATDPDSIAALDALEARIAQTGPYGTVAENGFLRAVLELHGVLASGIRNPFAEPFVTMLWRGIAIYQVTVGHRASRAELDAAIGLTRALRGLPGATPEQATAAHLSQVRAGLLAGI